MTGSRTGHAALDLKNQVIDCFACNNAETVSMQRQIEWLMQALPTTTMMVGWKDLEVELPLSKSIQGTVGSQEVVIYY